MKTKPRKQNLIQNAKKNRRTAELSLAFKSGRLRRIEHATWLSDGLLLLAGSSSMDDGSWPTATIHVGGKPIASQAETVRYEASEEPAADNGCGSLVLVYCESPGCTSEVPQSLVLGDGPTAIVFDSTQLPAQLVDVRTVLRESVAGLNADARARVLQFLAAACAERLAGSSAARTSLSLFAAREALRERLPVAEIGHRNRLGGHVESFYAVTSNSFYMRGWIASIDSPLVRVTAVSPEGCRTELRDRLYWLERPDLNTIYGDASVDGITHEFGFRCYFEVETPSRLQHGWLIEVVNAAGEEMEVHVPGVESQAAAVRHNLLWDIAADLDGSGGLMSRHLAPALVRMQERTQDQVHVEKVVQYGDPPADPAVSLIIPLYGRIDFLEQQLSQFAHDPDIARSDVIYVLDSPELAPAILFHAPRLKRLYHVPFRVAVMRSNVGYAGANNAGVSLARGRLFLLLNADVLPDRPGWLEKMAAFYEATPRIGALGPKLLYEDDSVQHAGMYFYRDQTWNLWSNHHYYKGYHRTLPAANVSRRVPAVTGACLMIDGGLYREIGGLNGLYIQGDFEDSDLCLRLAESGRENWYLSDVELYHLEGQSYPSEIRKLNDGFNRWLQSDKWHHLMERLMLNSGNGWQASEPTAATMLPVN